MSLSDSTSLAHLNNKCVIIIMTYFINPLGEIVVVQLPGITYRHYYGVSVSCPRTTATAS